MQNIDHLYSGETTIRRRKNDVRFELNLVCEDCIFIIHPLVYFSFRTKRKLHVCSQCVGDTGATLVQMSCWTTSGSMWQLARVQWFLLRWEMHH